MIYKHALELSGLAEYLRSQLIGQDDPITQISGLVEQAFCGLRYPRIEGCEKSCESLRTFVGI
jgi:hypothetical protein